MCGGGSARASAASMRDWTSPIHPWKSLSRIVIRACRLGERLQHVAPQDLDLLLRNLELPLAIFGELEAALVGGERVLERQLARFHSRHDFFQLGERGLEGGLA